MFSIRIFFSLLAAALASRQRLIVDRYPRQAKVTIHDHAGASDPGGTRGARGLSGGGDGGRWCVGDRWVPGGQEMSSGLIAPGIPASAAQQLSHLPPIGALFAALLSYNPMRQLRTTRRAARRVRAARPSIVTRGYPASQKKARL